MAARRPIVLTVLLLLGGSSVACASARVPLGPRAAPAAHPAYVVRKGDTIYSLARRFNVPQDQLLTANALKHAKELRAGQKLHVPPPAKRGSLARVPHPAPAGRKAGRQGSLAKAPSGPVAKPSRRVAGARRAAVARKAAPKRRAPAPVVAHAPTQPPSKPAARGMFRWPVGGASTNIITSHFGHRGGRPHDGIDIGAQQGAPVRAAADGEVVFSAAHRGYGNLVILRHTDGFMTIYAHQEANLVHPGQRVRRGDLIARVGSTGHSTGPHLHFEVRRGTQPDNPLNYLQAP